MRILLILFFGFGLLRAKECLILISPYEFSEKDLVLLEEGLKKVASLTTASAETTTCFGDSVMEIKPTVFIYNIDTLKYDLLIMVGGVGALFYDGDKNFNPILSHFSRKGLVGLGIANLVIARAGLLRDKPATTIRDKMAIEDLTSYGAHYRDQPVVRSGRILTAPSVNRQLLREIVCFLKDLRPVSRLE